MFEKLITILTALVAAIEANTAAHSGAKVTIEAPAGEGKKTRATKSQTADTNSGSTAAVTQVPAAPTVADVRAAATKLLEVNNNQDDGLFASLNAKYGMKKISEAPEDKRAEVIAAIEAKIKEVAAKASTPASAANAI